MCQLTPRPQQSQASQHRSRISSPPPTLLSCCFSGSTMFCVPQVQLATPTALLLPHIRNSSRLLDQHQLLGRCIRQPRHPLLQSRGLDPMNTLFCSIHSNKLIAANSYVAATARTRAWRPATGTASQQYQKPSQLVVHIVSTVCISLIDPFFDLPTLCWLLKVSHRRSPAGSL